MSRPKRKSTYRPGTQRGTIVARRGRAAKAIRLGRGLRFFAIGSVLILGTLWAGAWLTVSETVQRTTTTLQTAFYQSTAKHGFVVQDVLVEGRQNADPEILLGLLDVERGEPIFAFDPSAALTRLEKESWIESARIERRLPGLVYVSIHERKPFALWQNQGKLRLIDPKGVVITDAIEQMARFRDLPLVVGDGAPVNATALFDLMRAEPLLMERLEAATYVGGRRWDLKMKNNITVSLPEGDQAVALRRLGEAQEQRGLLDEPIETVDLRNSSRMIVRSKPGAAQEVGFKPEKAI